MSPTQRTLNWFRARGFPVAVVEKYVWTGKFGFRKDLWGGDCMALHSETTLLIQAGASQHHAGKIIAALADPKVAEWLGSPHREFWVLTWGKRVGRKLDGTKRKGLLWTPRATAITLTGAVELELSK